MQLVNLVVGAKVHGSDRDINDLHMSFVIFIINDLGNQIVNIEPELHLEYSLILRMFINFQIVQLKGEITHFDTSFSHFLDFFLIHSLESGNEINHNDHTNDVKRG